MTLIFVHHDLAPSPTQTPRTFCACIWGTYSPYVPFYHKAVPLIRLGHSLKLILQNEPVGACLAVRTPPAAFSSSPRKKPPEPKPARVAHQISSSRLANTLPSMMGNTWSKAPAGTRCSPTARFAYTAPASENPAFQPGQGKWPETMSAYELLRAATGMA